LVKDLSALTGIRSDDVTQHIYELLKGKSKDELKPLMARVTDPKLREELEVVYNTPYGKTSKQVNTGRFSLSQLIPR
jgi:hypothetical protein